MMLRAAASRTTISILLLALAASCRSEPSAPKLTMQFRTQHFLVRADPADPFLARLTAKAAEQQLRRVSRILGLPLDPAKPFKLQVFRSHYDLARATGTNPREMFLGMAWSSGLVSVDASGSYEPADALLAHEITHVVVFRILGPHARGLPLWFHEGLAQVIAGGYDRYNRNAVADAAAEDRLIPWKKLRKSFPKDEWELAYMQSHNAVRDIVDHHGIVGIREIIHLMAKGASFDEAMRRAVGISGSAYEREWYRTVTQRYRVYRITRAAAACVSFLMAGLAVAAFIVRQRQKLEAARRWEREEMKKTLSRVLGDEPFR